MVAAGGIAAARLSASGAHDSSASPDTLRRTNVRTAKPPMPRTERNPRGSSPAKQKKPASRPAGFIEPMLLLKADSLPDDSRWLYELKLDGYRAIAFKRNGTVHLRSRNDNDFNVRYPGVVKALANMPSDTVIDGEVVAFDQEGRPSFNALQNYYGSAPA